MDNTTPTVPTLYESDPNTEIPQLYGVPATTEPLPQEVLEQRATKADYALRDQSPGLENLLQSFTSGNEQSVREDAARKLDMSDEANRIQAIKNIAAKGPGEATPQDYSILETLTSGKKHNPAFVLESQFAKNWVADNTYARPESTSVFRNAANTDPNKLTSQQMTSMGIIAASQALVANHEQLVAKKEAMPLLSFTKNDKVTDFVLNLFPLYTWHDTANVLNKAGVSNMFLGSNLDAQVQYGWAQVFAGNIEGVIGKINQLYEKNPTAALALSKALQMYSFNDRWADNLISGIDLATTAGPVAKGIATKAFTKAMGLARDLKAGSVVSAADVRGMAAREAAPKLPEITSTQGTATGKFTEAPFKATPDFYRTPQQLALFELEDQQPLTPLFGKMKMETQFKDDAIRNLPTSARYETYQMAGEPVNPPWEPTQYAKETYEIGYPFRYQPMARDENTGKFVRKASQLELPLEGGGKGNQPYTTQGNLPLGAFKKPLQSVNSTEGTVGGTLPERQVVALREIVKAGSTPNIDLRYILNTTGNIEAGTVHAATEEVKQRLAEATLSPSSKDPLNQLQDLVLNASHAFQPWKYYHGVNADSGEMANRFLTSAMQRSNKMTDALLNTAKVTRFDDAAYQKIIDAAKEQDLRSFRQTTDGLFNTEVIYPWDTPTNVGYHKYKFGKIGEPEVLFDSPETAHNYARQIYKFPEEGFSVEQQGSGFHISVVKPIRETFDSTWEHILTENTTTPRTWSAMLFGRHYKTADDLLGKMHAANRQMAEQAQTNLFKLMQEAGNETVGKLSDRERLELRRVFEYDRVFPVSERPGDFGVERATENDFQKVFMEIHGKMPTPEQSAAYQTVVAINDWDGTIHQLAWQRDLERQGVEMVRLNIPGVKGTKTDWFHGRRVDNVDWAGKDDAVIYYHDPVSNTFQIMHKHDRVNLPDFKKMVDDAVSSKDFDVIQIANPKARPLKEHLGQDTPINFVVTGPAEVRPMKLGEAAEWRPGMHMMYNNPFFAKQANVVQGYKGLHYYLGDSTLYGINTEKEGRAFVAAWNKAQELMVAKRDIELEQHLRDTLPLSMADFKKMYTGAGPGGGLNQNTPITLVRSGQETLDAAPELKNLWPNIKENRMETYDLWGALDRTFIGERGAPLSTMAQVGSERNPMFHIEAPNLMNPWDTMVRGMGNAVRARFMGDYKTFAAQHWVEEFGKLLNPGIQQEQMRNSPLYYLSKGNKLYADNVDSYERALAEGARQRIMNFIGYRSEMSKELNSLQQKAVDYLGGRGDSDTWKGYIKNGVLDWISDPTAHVRAAAFHLHIGMFNPIQFWKNSQTLLNINAIVPEHGIKSTFGSMLQRFVLTNEDPAILDKYAKIASNVLGWKPEHFVEATNAMKSTGWHNIGHEVAWRSDIVDPQLFTSKLGQWLDKGTLFFNESERGLRMTAWNAAYSEWRAANPAGVLNDVVKGKLLARANDLTGNMTRASNAAWQEGIFSVPTQFSAYNARIMEQMLTGMFTNKGRLSKAESARLLGAFSLAYGIPVGMGSMVGFAPLYEDIKTVALNRGININDKWFVAATEGLTGFIASSLTGQEYNTGKAWGPGGGSLISDILGMSTNEDKKKSLLEIAGGPGGATLGNIFWTLNPVSKAIYAASVGDSKAFPMLAEDFARIGSNISTVSLAQKIWTAVNAHKYLSKNNSWIGDVTTIDAVAMAMGLTPRQISDGFIKAANEKDIKAWKEDYQNRASIEFRNGVLAARDNNQNLANDHFRRARAYHDAGDLTWKERSDTYNRAMNQNKNYIDMINQREWKRLSTTPNR